MVTEKEALSRNRHEAMVFLLSLIYKALIEMGARGEIRAKDTMDYVSAVENALLLIGASTEEIEKATNYLQNKEQHGKEE